MEIRRVEPHNREEKEEDLLIDDSICRMQLESKISERCEISVAQKIIDSNSDLNLQFSVWLKLFASYSNYYMWYWYEL